MPYCFWFRIKRSARTEYGDSIGRPKVKNFVAKRSIKKLWRSAVPFQEVGSISTVVILVGLHAAKRLEVLEKYLFSAPCLLWVMNDPPSVFGGPFDVWAAVLGGGKNELYKIVSLDFLV